MQLFRYKIKDANGIHARPAGMLAKLAQEFEGTVITIEKNEKKVRLDRVLMLMGLGVKHGDEVKVSAEGSREEEAVVRVKKFFEENL